MKEKRQARLEEFLRMDQQKQREYDFREEIVIFPNEDPLERFIIYKAIGIGEKKSEYKQGTLGLDETLGIYKNYQNCVLIPKGEADQSPLFQEIWRCLWDEKYLTACMDGERLKGDTMNSAYTTLNQLFQSNGIKAGSNLKVLYFCMQDDGRKLIHSCAGAEEFLRVSYTLGNFIPVPPAFQKRGYGTPSKDYWDLALLAIYDYYHGTNYSFPPFSLRWLVGDVGSAKKCQRWLKCFSCWDDFVERNYLQPFVGPYGFPRELWKEHFTGDVMPLTESQFEEFFTNASSWILARGNRIAIAVKDKMKENPDLEELAEQMSEAE